MQWFGLGFGAGAFITAIAMVYEMVRRASNLSVGD